MNSVAISGIRLAALRRGRMLEYVTIAWNSLEALISVGAGLLAGSIALVGFGFDSVIETCAGVALLWRLRHANEMSPARRERAESVSLKVVGWSFFLLAAYVGSDAALALWKHEAPEHSTPGIVITALSLIVMPILARAKRKVARQLNSSALEAESRQTDLCAYLSAIVLTGLVLNLTLSWWWADPVAALAMTPIIVREGGTALRGDSCGCHTRSDSCGDSCGEVQK